MVGEIGINFEECGSPFTKPFDYSLTKGPVFESLARYARVIKKHGSIALMEICHEGSECEVGQPTDLSIASTLAVKRPNLFYDSHILS